MLSKTVFVSFLPFVIAQLKLIDLAYFPFEKGPPNAGIMRAYLTRNILRPSDASWYDVCGSTSSQSRLPLARGVCKKYGYNDGTVHERIHDDQVPCAEFSCPNEYSLDCSLDVGKQWDKNVLYVVCYLGVSPSQPPPNDPGGSLNCDFENGYSCGWELHSANVISAGMHYQRDATLGTADGHVITTQDCQASPYAWGPLPWTEAVIVSPVLEHCFGYTEYCFSMSVLSLLDSHTLNLLVIDYTGRDNWVSSWTSRGEREWSVIRTTLSISAPFRLKLQFTCPKGDQQQVLFMDNFIVTTGECPTTTDTYCYNNGKELQSNNGDRYCDCPNAVNRGKQCEVTTCTGTVVWSEDTKRVFALTVLSMWLSVLYA